MALRILAGAFLCCENKVLLIKRGSHKELATGLWAGIGGHLDLNDIKNPKALDMLETCYREVQEETGITRDEICYLKLRYIAMRRDGDEIRLHHHYFGELENEIALPECDEGELHWINKADLPGLPMTTSGKEALMHWILHPDDEGVYFVAVNPAGDCSGLTHFIEYGDALLPGKLGFGAEHFGAGAGAAHDPRPSDGIDGGARPLVGV
jgi:8-oxo-dGTP diphosphatase